MPLEAERDLRLALSAEANDLVQVLIGLCVHSMGGRRKDRLVALLQNGVRCDLVHETAFAFKKLIGPHIDKTLARKVLKTWMRDVEARSRYRPSR